jgi:hypothetical protein
MRAIHADDIDNRRERSATMRTPSWLVTIGGAALLLHAAGPFSARRVRGSGTTRSESRAVADFDAVALGGVGELTIEQTGAESLTIEAEDNILPLLTSDVRGGRLHLGTRPGVGIEPTRPIRYRLTVARLRAIALSGSGGVACAALTTDELSLAASGVGSLDLHGLRADALRVEVSGTANVSAAGQVARQTVALSGSGSYAARDLACEAATVSVSGTGGVALQVRDTLDAAVSGVGSIVYYGDPSVRRRVSGVGSIRRG